MISRHPWRRSAPGQSSLLSASGQGSVRSAHPATRRLAGRRLAAGRLAGAAVVGVLGLTLAGCGSSDSMAGMDHSTMSASPSDGDSMAGMDHGSNGDGHDHMHMGDTVGDATSATEEGFTLDAITTNANTENDSRLTFRISKENGAPLTQFIDHHEKPLHLFLYNSDLSSFLHVHPVMNGVGTWQVELPPMPAGKIHLAANFVGVDDNGDAKPVMLGGDFEVPGTASATPLPDPVDSVTVDGYKVTLDDGLKAGTQSKLNLTITKKGKPAELVPYLGAWAHVAAIDSATMAAAHLHPAQEWEEGAAAPAVLTVLYTPTAPGTERVFVEFSTAEGNHRAEFTRQVG